MRTLKKIQWVLIGIVVIGIIPMLLVPNLVLIIAWWLVGQSTLILSVLDDRRWFCEQDKAKEAEHKLYQFLDQEASKRDGIS